MYIHLYIHISVGLVELRRHAGRLRSILSEGSDQAAGDQRATLHGRLTQIQLCHGWSKFGFHYNII